MPQFSFVIPVYNGERYLEGCVTSILSQTNGDLEVICVNDASTDNSAQVLSALSQLDDRVRVINHEENKGSARARRLGALSSKGDYVLFADQDDSYSPQTCECLSKVLAKHPVDVLNYRAVVINEGGADQGEIDCLQRILDPVIGVIESRDILTRCFVNLDFSYSIWNKAYQGDMARRAFKEIEDVAVPLGEDNYESFVLLTRANSYWGIGETLYYYHYGRGYTGRGFQTLDSFKRTCGLRVAADLIARFVKVYAEDNSEVTFAYLAAREHMLRYTFERLVVEIDEHEQQQGRMLILDSWPLDEVCSYVIKEHPDQFGLLVEAALVWSQVDLSAVSPEFLQKLNKAKQLSDEARRVQNTIEALRKTYENSRAFQRGHSLVRWVKKVLH